MPLYVLSLLKTHTICYTVCYNNTLRWLLHLRRDSNAKEMFAPDRIPSFGELARQNIYQFKTRINNIPRSKYVCNLKPFWSEELSLLKKDKMHWFTLWTQQGSTLDDNDPIRIQMNSYKKLFCKFIRTLSCKYNNRCIAEAASLAEIDRDRFWRTFIWKGPLPPRYTQLKMPMTRSFMIQTTCGGHT